MTILYGHLLILNVICRVLYVCRCNVFGPWGHVVSYVRCGRVDYVNATGNVNISVCMLAICCVFSRSHDYPLVWPWLGHAFDSSRVLADRMDSPNRDAGHIHSCKTAVPLSTVPSCNSLSNRKSLVYWLDLF